METASVPLWDLDTRRRRARRARAHGEIVLEEARCELCGWREPEQPPRYGARHQLTADVTIDSEEIHAWVCGDCARWLGRARRNPRRFAAVAAHLARLEGADPEGPRRRRRWLRR